MLQTVYLHNRSSSPTMRTPDGSGTAYVNELTDTDSPSKISCRAMRAELVGLSKLHKSANGTTYQKKPLESFTTVSYPEDRDQSNLQFPRYEMQFGMDRPTSLSSEQMTRLAENFCGAPLMHRRSEVVLALSENCYGKNPQNAALQTLKNISKECEKLEQENWSFTEDCQILSNNSMQLNAGLPRTSEQKMLVTYAPALLRIMKSVWPTIKFLGEEEKQLWSARTLRDPNPFIAQSYDALTLVLEQIGVSAQSAKNALSKHEHLNDPEMRASIAQECAAADLAIRHVSNVIKANEPFMMESAFREGHSVVSTLRAPLNSAVIREFEKASIDPKQAIAATPPVDTTPEISAETIPSARSEIVTKMEMVEISRARVSVRDPQPKCCVIS